VKAPYAALDNYTKQKIKRYPFYYERETLEKLQQAIGRTNRNKDDWSITYMMDSMLNNLVWKLPNYITSRVKNKKLY
jgi:Rad3-related DNA helicase